VTTSSPPTVDEALDGAVAVVGVAGRFPGARDLDAFWRNLCGGVEAASEFSDDDLLRAGVPAESLREPRLVRRRPVLDDVDLFDAAFFGYSPREAETIDPQQRIFLECAWEALESTGHDSRRFDGAIGVFGGGGPDLYYLTNILPNQSFLARIGQFAATLGNEKDFFAPRVSYKLNLRGPSISVLTGCSSSLVAVHLAVQSLLSGESDLALAGGVTVFLPRRAGYLHTRGGVNSPDGRCRAFDADADGTVPGDAAAVVALRRLDDALADGDPILGVIRGSAVNNDGSDKVGFTAPSVSGQADVIAEALGVADVSAESIGYVEAHGTGTPLGDAIEVAALTRAFDTDRRQFCRLGTLKPNIGHTDTASGVSGLIKILLAFRHEVLPPSINCDAPNPEIDFPSTPFRVNTELSAWPANGVPRRAGVSSFAVGGTNAHVVVEEPPLRRPAPPGRDAVLLLVSARTPAALDDARTRLADHLDAVTPGAGELADIAWTTQVGRAEFAHRVAVVATDAATASAALRAPLRPGWHGHHDTERPGVAFLFPGQGSQYVGMGRGLYESEPVFRAVVDECAELLRPELGLDLRTVLYPGADGDGDGDADGDAQARLADTALTQPALFVVEYALARQLSAVGIRPAAMLGHSVGEFVAATLAGVFTLETALRLVAARGRLMAALPTGAMAAVALPESEVASLLDGTGVSLAAVNGTTQTVVSGPSEAVDALVTRLRADGIASTPLRTSHAFHSAMMEAAVAPFVEAVRAASPGVPRLPFVSGVTGTWITAEQATDPAYWGCQLREPVRFAAGLAALDPGAHASGQDPGATLVGPEPEGPAPEGLELAGPELVLVEIGPASGITDAVASLGRAREAARGGADLMALLGRLWLRGARADWPAVHEAATRRRSALPTYPFQRASHWVEPPPPATSPAAPPTGAPTQVPTQAGTAGRDAGSATAVLAATAADAPRGVNDVELAEGTAKADLSPVEVEVRDTWREVMGLGDVGPDDNFFDLGGHSLFAAQIVARLEAVLPIRLTVAEILGGVPTVAGMAATVEQRLLGAPDALSTEEAARPLADPESTAAPHDPADAREILESAGIGPRVSTGPAPVSFTQEALWFLAQVHPDSPFYNMSLPLRLTGPLDVAALREAVRALIARHEVLRTGFGATGGRPHQIVAADVPTPLVCHPAPEHPPDALGIDDWIRTRTHQPFDLARPPLTRFDLLPLGPDDHVLTICVHHLVGDGLSMGILAHEIGAFYEAATRGEHADLTPLPIQFADFATWQRADAQSAAIAREIDHWRERLRGLRDELELPTDLPRPPSPTFHGDSARFGVSADVSARLRRVARAGNATVYMLVLAAFKTLLHRYSGAIDLLVGSATHGRDRPETAGLIGFFANTLVLRTDLGGDPTFETALARVRDTCLTAFEHQSAPFESVVAAVSPGRDPAAAPMFRVSLVQQRLPTDARMGDVEVGLAGSRIGIIQYDLVVHLWENDGRIEGTVVGSQDLFAPDTVRRLARHLETVLTGIADDAGRPLSALPLLTPAEIADLLDTERSTTADDAAVPDAVALAGTALDGAVPLVATAAEPVVVAGGGLRVVDGAGRLVPVGVIGTVLAVPPDSPVEPVVTPDGARLPHGARRTGLRGRRLADGRLALRRARFGWVAVDGVPLDLDALADRVRAAAPLDDCAITLVPGRDTGGELAVHVVPRGRYDGGAVTAAVRTALAAGPRASIAGVVIPVSRIPRLPSGTVDLDLLGTLMAVDADLSGRWERALGAVPRVAEAVVAVRVRDATDPYDPELADHEYRAGPENGSGLADGAACRPLLELVAFVVAEPAGGRGDGDLRATLRHAGGQAGVTDRFGRVVRGVVRIVRELPRLADGRPDLAQLAVLAASPDAVEAPVVGGRPMSPLEEEIAAIWRTVLGLGSVGLEDNFFDLGGHSLRAAEVIFQLGERIGTPLPIATLFRAPTITALATEVEAARARGATGAAPAGQPADLGADLATEVELDPEIRVAEPVAPAAARRPEPRAVLLTGATGFLGAFLLAELMERTGARVYCVVRATDAPAATARVRAALERFGRWDDAYAPRIVGLPGELGQPLLGLGASTFATLAGKVDLIIHNGASVSMLAPYASLRDANVGGTVEVLRLSARGGGIPVHHVSSAGTVLAARANPPTITEDLRVDAEALVPGGYTLTKWVAERLAERARQRGLPVTVYRPGRVGGDSRTGATTTDDVLWSYLRAVVDTGAIPDGGALDELELGIVPVDYVAGALVELARTAPADGRVYHLTNPDPTPLGPMLARMRAAGYVFAPVPEDEWAARLRAAAGGSTSVGVAAALERLYGATHDTDSRDTGASEGDLDVTYRFDDTNTRAALAGSGIACPPVDDALLDRYLRFAVSSGFLPPADSPASPAPTPVPSTASRSLPPAGR